LRKEPNADSFYPTPENLLESEIPHATLKWVRDFNEDEAQGKRIESGYGSLTPA
jgi:hypothetical protein